MSPLLQPIDLGFTRIRNRIVMGSMHTGLEDHFGGYKKLAQFYRERAEGGVGLIITGGVSPTFRGRLSPFSSQLSSSLQLYKHRYITQTVHRSLTKICLQLLHAGRYAWHPFCLAPSAIKSPISPFTPAAMTLRQIKKTIHAYGHSALLAKKAGYDGVEVMGSEGYLINQFSCRHTNKRNDEWGGKLENRIRFSVEIIKEIRKRVGWDWIIIYRLSMLDLLPDGNRWDEIITHARAIEAAGATIINTGIGWHEVRIPTIASMVPPAAFSWVTKKLKQTISLPLITSNRINRVALAERCLINNEADMVSMARPFLADACLVKKIKNQQVDLINTCIGCNQGCLDHIFNHQQASCLVNPRACYETVYPPSPVQKPATIIIVGLGVAGLSCALTAAQCGHKVIAYDAAGAGGQFALAARIPGKEDYHYTVAYFIHQLERYNVEIHLHTQVGSKLLQQQKCDAIVIATGVRARLPCIDGIDHVCVIGYEEAIKNENKVGRKVAIIGAGGIGFDVAEKLIHYEIPLDWYQYWGIDRDYKNPGGLSDSAVNGKNKNQRDIILLQRKKEKPGRHLGKTTGWIHRLSLKKAGVEMYTGVEYKKIDDAGLHIMQEGKELLIAADSVVICAGQIAENTLYEQAQSLGLNAFIIGGAKNAGELNAERAIREGMELGLALEKHIK